MKLKILFLLIKILCNCFIMIIIIIIMIIITIKGEYYQMETIFMNTENSGTNEPHRFRLDLTDKLILKKLKTNMALANFSIYYTWKIFFSNME